MTAQHPKFPPTLYLVWGWYDGWTPLGDSHIDLAYAVDEVLEIEARSDGPDYWRVTRMDFDPDTGLPERTTFVDDEVRKEALSRFANDDEAPVWLTGRDPWTAEDWAAQEADDWVSEYREAAE